MYLRPIDLILRAVLEEAAVVGLIVGATTLVGGVPGGVVAIAAVVAAEPTLVLLDEPTAGLAQREVESFAPLLRRLQARHGASIVVVEHDMRFVMSLAERVAVLDFGRLIADDAPEAVINDPDVRRAYLGEQAA